MPNFGKSAPRPKTGAAKGAPRRTGTSGFQGAGAAPKKPHRKGPVESREMSGRKPDRGSNWEPRAPKTEAGRKPRHTAEDRATRAPRSFDDRAPRSNDGTQRREWSDKPRYGQGQSDRPAKKSWSDKPSYSDRKSSDSRDSRDSRPSESRSSESRGSESRGYEARGPRKPSGSSDRSYGARSGSGSRSDSSDRSARNDRGFRSDRPARDFSSDSFRGSSRDSGRTSEPRSNSREYDRDRNPYREDRVSRDKSRDSSFVGARDKNPNRKAFFEDKVLEKLVVADASEILIQGSFEEMGLHPKLVTALRSLGAETPFPIQQSTIPADRKSVV